MKRRRGGIADHGEWTATPLEIEFEDEEADGGATPEAAAPDPHGSPRARLDAARRRRRFQVIGTASAIAVLAVAAVMSTHDDNGTSGTAAPSRFYIDDSAAVRIVYLNSNLVSTAPRRLEVELNVTPLNGQPVKVTGISVSEGGVSVAPVGISATFDIPAAGQNVLLVWTIQDCARVPMDESMAYVEVVTRSAGGFVMDRFTILGDRYAADISRLLHDVCGPGLDSSARDAPHNGPGPATPRATGPLSTVS